MKILISQLCWGEWNWTMKKEQKSEIKILEKSLAKTLRMVTSQYNYKIVANCIYKGLGEFFTHAVFFVRVVDGDFKLVVRHYIKTYEEDNLFWTIFNMPDNINQRESLRANGAFVVQSIQLAESQYTIMINSDLESISKTVLEEFEIKVGKFLESINLSHEEYYQYILHQANFLSEKLKKMLAYILLNESDKALCLAKAEIEKGNRGGYQNDGKDIYQYIVDYCKNHSLKMS